MAKVQRLVGIDFGTSTSIVKVKRYQGDRPVGDSHISGSVTFGNGESDSKAVTAVRLNADGAATCGTEALDQTPGSTIFQEFKMDLESPDREKRRQAMERTEDYFRYLYNWYDHQRSDLGAIDDEEHTLVSYPVKWSPEAREYLLETARNAGFQNVRGMDEPTAALYATLCRKMSEINQQGLLRAGESGYMLLVDMGAGTTDLAVCRYRVKDGGPVVRVDQIENEIIAAWPMDSGAATFGGREVDRVLEEYVIDYLKSCGFPAENAEQAVRGAGNSSTAAKRWKETTVSKVLNDGKNVESCAFVAPFMMFLPQSKPFPAFGRREFEAMLGERLEQFKELVAGCLAHASRLEPELLAKKLDLVVLTGGHSSWYFAEELLNGTMPGLALPQLELVQKERGRVIRLSNPQETVALGLVYSQLPFHVAEAKPEPERGRQSSDPKETTQRDASSTADSTSGVKNAAVKVAQSEAKVLHDTVPVVGALGDIASAAAEAMSKDKQVKTQQDGKAEAPSHEPEKWPTNDQLALYVKEFINRYDGTENASNSIKKLTRGGLAVIREKLCVPDSDEVLLYHDDTLFLSGKNGFVFCTSGIITRGLVEKRTFVSWLSFATGILRPFEEKSPIMLYDSAGDTQMITYNTDNKYPKASMHRFLSALQAHLRSRFGLAELVKKVGLTDPVSVSNEQLAQSADRFIHSYDKGLINSILRGDPAKLAKHLNIPDNAKIYLYHDDTITENGKVGFVITDLGFYCRTNDQPVFTEWRIFFANSLEIDSTSRYKETLCRRDATDGLTKPIAHCLLNNASRSTDVFVFIAHLHSYLRSLYA